VLYVDWDVKHTYWTDRQTDRIYDVKLWDVKRTVLTNPLFSKLTALQDAIIMYSLYALIALCCHNTFGCIGYILNFTISL